MRSTIRCIVPPTSALLFLALAAVSPAHGQRTSDRRRSIAGDSRATLSDERRASSANSELEQQADSAYRVAMDALNDGDYTRAALLFQRVADRYSGTGRAGPALYYRAFALSKAGGSRNLSNALTALEALHDDYSDAYTRLEGKTLRIQICGQLARQGDERCASEVVTAADPPDRSASSGSRQPSSCPKEDDENDDRIAALNALLQMNSDQALPVLERLLGNKQTCEVMRKKAVFLVSQKRSDRSADILMNVARNDPSSDVREAAVFWLGQTNSERAVDILAEILEKSNDAGLQEKAIFSLSQTRSPRAQQIVRDVAQRESAPKSVRDQAIFWLGQRRDGDNAEFLRNLFPRLKDQDLREKVLFSLAQQRGEGNEKWLIDLALNDREDMEMRKKALFWAGQQRSVDVGDIAGLYDRVKDREMKEQVIFTLTQRRETAAVDKLMSIAKSDPDRELRSKAIFWLGQSRDPRVVKFLEELINKEND